MFRCCCSQQPGDGGRQRSHDLQGASDAAQLREFALATEQSYHILLIPSEHGVAKLALTTALTHTVEMDWISDPYKKSLHEEDVTTSGLFD